MLLVIIGTLALCALGAVFFLINRQSSLGAPPANRSELLERMRRLP